MFKGYDPLSWEGDVTTIWMSDAETTVAKLFPTITFEKLDKPVPCIVIVSPPLWGYDKITIYLAELDFKLKKKILCLKRLAYLVSHL